MSSIGVATNALKLRLMSFGIHDEKKTCLVHPAARPARPWPKIVSHSSSLCSTIPENRTVLSSGAIPPADDLLTWDTLRPVLKCPNLTLFELHWETPLAMSHADLEDLAASWPALETLILNPQPLPSAEPSPLTLDALLPFARHCPRLRTLGLYISASAPHGTLGVTYTPFRSLRKLDFGVSSIADAAPVALFLSQLCPSDCRVTSGVNWPDQDELIAPESEDDMDLIDGADD